MTPEPLSFGIEAIPQNVSFTALADACRRAERIGFDSAWIFDHFVPVFSTKDGSCLECWTVITALAATTTRLRLGSLVACNSYRHPALHAKIGATLDVLSGGRLEFGIGAGRSADECRAYGFPFLAPGDRIDQLAEAVRVIRSLWTQPRTTFDGRYYTLTDAPCEPKPVQRPHPPIWIGGQGERRTLRVVAEEADGWNMPLHSVDEYRHKVDVLARHCDRIGRDPATIRRSLHATVVVREDERDLPRAVEAANADGYLRRPDLVQVTGTPEQCADLLRPYVELGAGVLLLMARPPYDFESWELVLERVRPLLGPPRPA